MGVGAGVGVDYARVACVTVGAKLFLRTFVCAEVPFRFASSNTPVVLRFHGVVCPTKRARSLVPFLSLV